MDKAGAQYWEDAWSHSLVAEPVEPHRGGIARFPERQFHAYFMSMLSRFPRGSRLLEVGCANSGWLPYFARQFAFEVSGLDYSATGCDQARRVLEKASVLGHVTQGDFFSPPENMGTFDVVVSLGVVEHYRDVVAAVAALRRLLRPGGRIITGIPNLSGILGLLQRTINPEVYRTHVPMDLMEICRAHELSGLQVEDCRYLMFANFGVLNLAGLRRTSPRWLIGRPVVGVLRRGTNLLWLAEERGVRLPPNRLTSPYCMVAAVAE